MFYRASSSLWLQTASSDDAFHLEACTVQPRWKGRKKGRTATIFLHVIPHQKQGSPAKQHSWRHQFITQIPTDCAPPAANDWVSLATSLEHQRRQDAAEKEALSSISFQPWLLSNSCSLFIYFHISLVTQAAAHRLTLPAPSATHATLLYLAQHDAARQQHGTG